MKDKTPKTNAMRILDKANIAYDVFTYEHGIDAIDGNTVAALLHQNPEQVFKTLVTISNMKEYFVFVIPVAYELDLKKAASVVKMKAVELIPVKEIQKVTGYIRGGCSPIGMRKMFTTYIHETCLQHANIIFSGGLIGCQIAMNPQDLMMLIQAKTASITKSSSFKNIMI